MSVTSPISPATRDLPRATVIATFVISGVAAFMSSLDNLVVTMALPSIREHLGTSLESLQWTVNAYTLVFAVLLLPAATLGDRFGRRKVFTIGLAIFTVSSAIAALAPNIETLIAARALQGVGGAVILPLSLPCSQRLSRLSGAVLLSASGVRRVVSRSLSVRSSAVR